MNNVTTKESVALRSWFTHRNQANEPTSLCQSHSGMSNPKNLWPPCEYQVGRKPGEAAPGALEARQGGRQKWNRERPFLPPFPRLKRSLPSTARGLRPWDQQ